MVQQGPDPSPRSSWFAAGGVAGAILASSCCVLPLALVTTANLDRRSFELNFEVSLVVYDSDFASQLRFMQTSYLESSDLIDPATWRKRPWPSRLVQNAAGMLSPLL